jgi:hypothetical protein
MMYDFFVLYQDLLYNLVSMVIRQYKVNGDQQTSVMIQYGYRMDVGQLFLQPLDRIVVQPKFLSILDRLVMIH